jgi:hypothetical protein
MSRFEKRVTDEQVASAREQIGQGTTLRAAAAEIPCAPSTLSYRIKKAEQAETADRGRRDDSATQPTVRTPSSGDGAGIENIGPLEILREALQATKPSGQPDWTTRINAARTLAALRPQELEPKQRPVEPEIVVFDLPPGSNSVIHRAIDNENDAPAGDAQTPAAKTPASPKLSQPTNPRYFYYRSDEDTLISIGQWSPPPSEVQGTDTVTLVVTDEPTTADRWRAELAAGRLPAREDES